MAGYNPSLNTANPAVTRGSGAAFQSPTSAVANSQMPQQQGVGAFGAGPAMAHGQGMPSGMTGGLPPQMLAAMMGQGPQMQPGGAQGVPGAVAGGVGAFGVPGAMSAPGATRTAGMMGVGPIGRGGMGGGRVSSGRMG